MNKNIARLTVCGSLLVGLILSSTFYETSIIYATEQTSNTIKVSVEGFPEDNKIGIAGDVEWFPKSLNGSYTIVDSQGKKMREGSGFNYRSKFNDREHAIQFYKNGFTRFSISDYPDGIYTVLVNGTTDAQDSNQDFSGKTYFEVKNGKLVKSSTKKSEDNSRLITKVNPIKLALLTEEGDTRLGIAGDVEWFPKVLNGGYIITNSDGVVVREGTGFNYRGKFNDKGYTIQFYKNGFTTFSVNDYPDGVYTVTISGQTDIKDDYQEFKGIASFEIKGGKILIHADVSTSSSEVLNSSSSASSFSNHKESTSKPEVSSSPSVSTSNSPSSSKETRSSTEVSASVSLEKGDSSSVPSSSNHKESTSKPEVPSSPSISTSNSPSSSKETGSSTEVSASVSLEKGDSSSVSSSSNHKESTSKPEVSNSPNISTSNVPSSSKETRSSTEVSASVPLGKGDSSNLSETVPSTTGGSSISRPSSSNGSLTVGSTTSPSTSSISSSDSSSSSSKSIIKPEVVHSQNKKQERKKQFLPSTGETLSILAIAVGMFALIVTILLKGLKNQKFHIK